MLFINKITEPGGLRSVRVEPETVKVILHGGREITYTKSNENNSRVQRLYPGLGTRNTQAEVKNV